jgi:hypothetical protein
MNNRLRASVAQIVAKLVSRRPTRVDEIPELVQTVELALTRLTRRPEPEIKAVAAPAPLRQTRLRAPRLPRAEIVVLESEPTAPPPPPRLLRRAEVVTAPLQEENAVLRPTRTGLLRGVVRWFDQRTRRGALRLPGLSGDVPVETGLLDEMAIKRLYKGQEVEATMSDDGSPRVVRLVVPGGASLQNSVGGMVRGRHARPVVVEMKREALRRAGARAEAESVWGRGRNR